MVHDRLTWGQRRSRILDAHFMLKRSDDATHTYAAFLTKLLHAKEHIKKSIKISSCLSFLGFFPAIANKLPLKRLNQTVKSIHSRVRRGGNNRSLRNVRENRTARLAPDVWGDCITLGGRDA
jgi:hypothetical protein